MKKILVFLTMSLLVFGMVAGVTASEDQGSLLELTLEQSIFKALDSEDNYDLRKAEIDVDKAERTATATEAKYSIVTSEVYLYSAYADLEMARMAVTIARKGEELQKTSTKLAVEKQYYELLKINRKLQNLLAKAETSQQLIRQAQIKFKAGTVAKKDIMDAEVQFAMDKASLAKAQRDKEVAYLQFKRLIGVGLSTEIKLISDFTFQPKEIPELQGLVMDAKDNSFAVFSAIEKLETCEELLDYGRDQSWTNTPTYDQVEFTRDEAELAQKSAERDAELDAYQAHSLLLGAEDQLKLLDKRVEQATEGLRLTKLQYQAGITTSLTVNQAANALAEVQAASLEALYNYNVIKAMMDKGIYSIPATGF